MFRAVRGKLKVMAGVFEGSGFVAAANRSVIAIILGVVTLR
jgi:hypothetical protein